jgi:N-acyl-D-aspartate/D-glutamate deacylase
VVFLWWWHRRIVASERCLVTGVARTGSHGCTPNLNILKPPARRFGLYPRKGALRPGSDADVMILDLDREWTLQPEHLRTHWPVSPFLGRAFHGSVHATLVRGALVYENGQVVGRPGHGRLLRRDQAVDYS